MRALRYRPDTGSLAIDPRAPEPAPAPGDALIRVTLAALDPADLYPCPGAPRTFTVGRQFVGVVESLHRDSGRAPIVGQRVVGCPSIPCAECDLCRGGTPVHCRNRRALGSPALDGCLAERLTIPARALLKVPDAVDDEAALLALPLASAIHAARHARLDRKSYVTVVGDNLVALLSAQVMTRHNAAVRLLGEQPDRMEVCEKWGVRHRPLREAGRRADQDVVIECTGREPALRAALGLLKPRGTLILMTPPHAAAPFDLSAVIEHELEVVGSRGMDSAPAIAEALGVLATGGMALTGLAPIRLTLDHAEQALRPETLRTAIAA